MRIPLLTSYTVSFIVGILFSYYVTDISYVVPIIGVIVVRIVLMVKHTKRNRVWDKAIYMAMIFLLGVFNMSVTRNAIVNSVIYEQDEYEYLVVTDPIKTSFGYKCYAETQNVSVELLIDDKTKIKYGDLILCTTKPKLVEEPALFESFDKQFFLIQQKTKYTVFVNALEINPSNRSSDLLAKVYAFRHFLEDRIDANLTTPHNSILKALVLGIKSDISADIRQEFTETGTIHVLAVSGLHTGIAYMIISLVFYYVPFRSVFIILVMWGFASLTGFSTSVVRAVIFLSIREVGMMMNKKSYLNRSLSLTTLAILCLNPYTLFNVGFQLSFGAVLGIMLFMPFFDKYYQKRSFLFRYLYGIIAVSISVQLAVTPIALYHFHNMSLSSIVANMLVIPYSFGVLCLSIPFLAAPSLFSWLMDNLIYSMLFYLDVLHKWTSLFLTNIQFDGAQCIVSFFIVGCLYFLLRDFKFKTFVLFSVLVSFFSGLVTYNYYVKYNTTAMYYFVGRKYCYLVCNEKGSISYIPFKEDKNFERFVYGAVLTTKGLYDHNIHSYQMLSNDKIHFCFDRGQYSFSLLDKKISRLSQK